MKIIYGVGAQKAGTSWLFDQLQKSKDVHGGHVKEMHYFDTLHMPSDQNHWVQRLETLNAMVGRIKGGFAPENAIRLRQIRQVTHQLACFAAEKGDHSAYVKALMEGRTTEKALLDFTPSYSGMPVEGLKDMASIGRAKFVFVLRDPVSRMWSQIRMRTKMLDVAKTDEEFFRISVEHAHHLKEINRYPHIYRADYLGTMDRLEQAVSHQDIKYVFYENLFRQDTMDEICEFLNVAPVKVESSKRVNLGREIPIDEDTRALIGNALRVQYEGVFSRFGGEVPEKWHETLAKVDAVTKGAPLSASPPVQAAAPSPVARGKQKVKHFLSQIKPVDRSPTKRPIVFLHIPKTAGQTVSKQVRLAIGARNVSPILTHSQAAADEQFPQGYRFYGGHLDWVAMASSLENCFSFTVLRDPKERIASLYFFLKREAQNLSPEELARKENTGKRYLLSVSADDYFFPAEDKMKPFVLNGYFNKYSYYFASRMMNSWSALRTADPTEVLRMAQDNAKDVSRIYGMSQLDLLAQDLSTVLEKPIFVQGVGTNVGPAAQTGSRWGDLCALFEREDSAERLLEFVAMDNAFLDSLNLADGPAIGHGGDL